METSGTPLAPARAQAYSCTRVRRRTPAPRRTRRASVRSARPVRRRATRALIAADGLDRANLSARTHAA